MYNEHMKLSIYAMKKQIDVIFFCGIFWCPCNKITPYQTESKASSMCVGVCGEGRGERPKAAGGGPALRGQERRC